MDKTIQNTINNQQFQNKTNQLAANFKLEHKQAFNYMLSAYSKLNFKQGQHYSKYYISHYSYQKAVDMILIDRTGIKQRQRKNNTSKDISNYHNDVDNLDYNQIINTVNTEDDSDTKDFYDSILNAINGFVPKSQYEFCKYLLENGQEMTKEKYGYKENKRLYERIKKTGKLVRERLLVGKEMPNFYNQETFNEAKKAGDANRFLGTTEEFLAAWLHDNKDNDDIDRVINDNLSSEYTYTQCMFELKNNKYTKHTEKIIDELHTYYEKIYNDWDKKNYYIHIEKYNYINHIWLNAYESL